MGKYHSFFVLFLFSCAVH